MLNNYYSIFEFNELDIETMNNILKRSFDKDFNDIKKAEVACDDNENIDFIYIAQHLSKHIVEMLDYYNKSMLHIIYHIYYQSKSRNLNVYELIYLFYKNHNYNVCFTKKSDITLLLLKIEKELKKDGRKQWLKAQN